MIFNENEYISSIDKLMRETDKDQGYMLTTEFKYISKCVEEYETNCEFHTRAPEQIVLAIFDKLKVKLPLWRIHYKGY